jgi:hypothetical protein
MMCAMNRRGLGNLWMAILIVTWLVARGWAASCPAGQSREEATLLQQEEKWAKALDHNDVQAVGCLLADEFQDADVNGAVHNRAEALARAAQPRHGVNRLEQMHARIYGHAGFVRGLNRVIDSSGKVVASVLFTDFFVYRDRRWQAVAGQETMLTESK